MKLEWVMIGQMEDQRGALVSNLPDLTGKVILHIIPDLAAGGSERGVIEVCDAVVRAGGRALVASRGGRMITDLEQAGGELVELDVASKNPVTIWQNAGRLVRLIRDQSISLVHAHSRAPAWSALHATKRTATPLVTTYHGAYSSQIWPKKAYNSVMARGDLVIANSAWIGEHIRQTHGLSEDRIIVIPRGVDFAAFDAEAVSAERVQTLRQDWGIGADNDRLILFLPARLTAWKGQILALRALAALTSEEQAGIILVMTGDAQGRNAYIAEIEQKISELGLVEATRLAGHCADMPAAMSAADIVLAPSLKPEAFGRTAAEAAAMGRPVIAADHGGARETVIDGETGARFEPGDVMALAGAIRSLISIGAPARAGMGASGRQHVLQHFSKQGLQAATLSVYSALITQGKLSQE